MNLRIELARFLENLDGLVDLSQLQVLHTELVESEWEVGIEGYGFLKLSAALAVSSARASSIPFS